MPGPEPQISEMLENVAEIIDNILKGIQSKDPSIKDMITETVKVGV